MDANRTGRRVRCLYPACGVVLLCAGLALSSRAFARESAARPPDAINPAVARPHLDAPKIPEPGKIRLPDAASGLLLASTELEVPAHLRLMIFAPHPDDETLAAGGLIQQVRSRGGEVRVVFITNGDGYVDGVRREVHRSRTSTADFIAYGERRRQEALHALREIGLRPSDGVFLGFPDDGIDDLWAGHWSGKHPYTSPYTRFDRSQYQESWQRGVEYDGSDLEREIKRVLRDFGPSWVLTPDPRDRHPDHCTTGVFVLDALRHLRHENEGTFARTHVLTYLVHAPDYPASAGWVKEIQGVGVGGSPTAGRVLAGAQWLSLPLTSGQMAVKRRAVFAYASQVQVMSPFLQQFLRPFELFAELDAAQVTTVPSKYAARFRHSR